MQQAPTLTSHDDNDEIDLMGLLGTVIDHKWLVAGISVAFMAVGTAYAVLATPVYQATALIQVEAKKNDMLGFSDISSMMGKESPSATEIELIKSRAIIGKVVDNLTLDLTVEPNRFPVIGEFMARHFKPDAMNTVATPWLGMNSFAWGGETLKIFRLELPQELRQPHGDFEKTVIDALRRHRDKESFGECAGRASEAGHRLDHC